MYFHGSYSKDEYNFYYNKQHTDIGIVLSNLIKY